MNIVLFGILIIMFLKAKNILSTIVVFFTLFFFVEVVFVEIVFGTTFSMKADHFDSLHHVTYSLFLFTLIFYLLNNNLKDNVIFHTCFKCFHLSDFFGFFILVAIFMYTYYNNLILYAGDYHAIADSKTPLLEYMIPLLTVMLIWSKGRFLIVIPFLMIGLLYGFTGERLKMFIYFFIFYLLFKEKFKTFNFKVLLIGAISLAVIISLYRSGIGLSGGTEESGVHISHFGELSISSMYLIDYSGSFSLHDSILYSVGIFLANVVPSAMLPLNMDIKRSLLDVFDIPGGGWLPIWFFAIGGYPMVLLSSLCISFFSRYIHYMANEVDHKHHIYFSTVYVLFLATSNNWLMYNPYQLFKFPLYAIILLLFIHLLVSMKRNNIH